MKNIQAYVDQYNSWQAIFNGNKVLDLASSADRHKIADRIDSDLSPENLHCDGEISHAEAERKYKHLMRCVRELQKLDPTVKFYEAY
jgi:hypothetical protein|tara:strand:+ start:6123 stop:6383 length:261 start_codon:yes stop_codon:yes gene_type:complete